MNVTQHCTQNTSKRLPTIDGRVTHHVSYKTNQRIRKRIKEAFDYRLLVDPIALRQCPQARSTMLYRSRIASVTTGQAQAHALWRSHGEPGP